jgi:hypothetical protein
MQHLGPHWPRRLARASIALLPVLTAATCRQVDLSGSSFVTMADNTNLGDVAISTAFAGYQAVGDLQLPTQLEKILDPKLFFRINRQFIVSSKAIREMYVISKSRVKINLHHIAQQHCTSQRKSREYLD